MILKPRPFGKPNIRHPLMPDAGLWLFNEGDGNIAYDLSGDGNDGTLTGDVSWAGGRLGGAINFPGSDDYIQLAKIGRLAFSTSFTIVADIYPTGTVDDRIFSRYYDGSNRSYDFMIDAGGNKYLKLVYSTNGAGTTTATSSTGVLTLNRWQRIAVTFEYPGNVCFYINAMSVGTAATTGAIFNNNMIPKIGIAYNLLKDYNGLMDHVMAYRKSLSAFDIAKLTRKPFCMFDYDPIELYSAASPVAVPTTGGFMTTNAGYWGV